MNILEVIAKKRDNKELTKEEIEFFVQGYIKEEVADYQAAALVMAIYINGMTKKETTDLTIAMANSGDVLDLSVLGNVVDKHSTGGIGDKITLILTPIIASLGVPVAKMSGRGLGITGGTIDKLESIPGYNINLSMEDFIESVKRIGISVIGQTLNLAPADKKIYALRDTISCTESIALISSSIMSKKIASGANKIVLDVTCGSGAFMKNVEEAKALSEMMMEIGKLSGKETICVITNMDEPVGYTVGNSLEVIEAIDILKGKYLPDDVKEVILELGSSMIYLYGLVTDIGRAKELMLEQIQNGQAYQKFLDLIQNQEGDISYIEDTDKFEKAPYIIPALSDKAGYISNVSALEIGQIAAFLGTGRVKKEDEIDPRVGIVLEKKVSDKVDVGDILAYIHANDETKAKEAAEKLKHVYQICDENVDKPISILEIVK